jgi:Carboxypeptidase regulatory-like domain
MERVRAALRVISLIVLLPAGAFAQASITGVVKDTSGAVLPGVTVEASSPVLIEKVRSAVSDSTGQFRIVDLRAGTYSVTFTLPGFSSVKREGIELEGSFTAAVNAELKVGAVTETITVTGETPVVDTQNVRRQTVISNDLITAIPAARAYAGLMTLMPNTVVAGGAASDVQVVPGMVVFGSAGGRGNEGRLQLDGLSTGSAFNGAGVSAYIPDVGNAQEVVMTTSGGLGEAEVGGPALSIVGKTGGNSVKGSFYASGVTEGMIGSNYTQELKDRGLTTPGSLTKVWDYNLGIGGPIMKDRIWYFGQARDEGSHKTVPGMFANANAGDPTKWRYVADRTKPAVNAASFRTTSLRLTAQPTARNKFMIFWDEQKPCEGAAFPGAADSVSACRNSETGEVIGGGTAAPTPAASATNSPEIAAYRDYGQRVRQATWQSPMTSRLLVEGGVGGYQSRWGGKLMPGSTIQDFVRVTEQCARGCADNGGIANLIYRSPNFSSNWQGSFNWRASASYVLGAQNMKFGYMGGYLIDTQKNFSSDSFTAYRTQNGVPDQITELINRFPIDQRVRYDAFYAQEQWTIGRMTLQGALRFDRAWSFFPEAAVGGVRFLPTVTVYPETKGVDSYKDITPRGGVAYDVFGNGKTALKVSVGKYLEAAQNGGNFSASRPTARIVGTTITGVTRTWTDRDNDFVPDCDLLNGDSQSTTIDFCGPISNSAFGTPVFNTTQDPALLAGWGVRASDWQIGVSVQQELMPRVSMEVGYYRRWLQNYTVTDNINQAPSDFGTFTINAPADPRLPDGGGYAIPGPLYNVNQNVASNLTSLVTKARNYGDQTQYSHSIALNLTARPRNGLVLQGGFNTAKTILDYCDIRAALPEMLIIIGTPTMSPTNPYCHQDSGFIKRFTALGSYTIPKVDIQIAGTVRSDQGDSLRADWQAPNSLISPILGRNLSNAAPSVTVNLIEPGTLYGDRVNELDLRIAKILRFGRTRTNVGVDIYNITNSAPVLTYNQAFVPNGRWLTPNSVLQPRFVKISAQIDF